MIIKGYGTRVASVALATPRFLNLIYNFFFLKIDFFKICITMGYP